MQVNGELVWSKLLLYKKKSYNSLVFLKRLVQSSDKGKKKKSASCL